MKPKSLVGILLLILALPLLAADKSKFDLTERSETGFWLGKSGPAAREIIRNEWLEVTMISGGYFTIGTTNGVSESILDNNCGVTYGHPYALTSYPVISVNGIWQKFDEFFAFGTLTPQQVGDTLRVTGTVANEFQVLFSIAINREASDVQFAFKVENLGAAEKTYGFGLVLDPALGKWGDGHAFFSGEFLRTEANLMEAEVPSSLAVWEKNVGNPGMGINLAFPQSPPKQMLAGNWQDLYKNESPTAHSGGSDLLYDLVLKFYWEDSFPAGGMRNYTSVMTFSTPDFGAGGFLRWDMPAAFSLTNNLLFPREFRTFVEANNSGPGSIQNGKIVVEQSAFLGSNQTDYLLPGNVSGSYFQPVPMRSVILYEDRIAELRILLVADNQVLDELHRNVFLPATPVSDSGLAIVRDSLVVNVPDIELIFGVENEETGHPVLDLAPENLFIYENGNRVNNFTLEKFSGGGSNLADVVFVLDVSGSMGDEIDAVRTNLRTFADSLVAKGFDYRIGIVTFSTTISDVWDFTDNVSAVEQNLAGIELWGGVEDSPAALYRASELSFREGSKRTLIWITDEPYPEHSYTQQQIVDRMLEMEITVHGVGLNSLQTEWFNPIVLPTGGNFYDINGNFRDILLDVTNLEAQDTYWLRFQSATSQGSPLELEVEIRYAGLGGKKSYNFTPTGNVVQQKRLSFYPNPFNPEITFRVDKTGFQQGEITVYNLLGQVVRQFPLAHSEGQTVIWNAMNENQVHVGSGLYIVRLSLVDYRGERLTETARIMYVK